MGKSKIGRSNLGNVSCYFCKGVKPVVDCEVVRVPGGGRAYKCNDCKEDDKRIPPNL